MKRSSAPWRLLTLASIALSAGFTHAQSWDEPFADDSDLSWGPSLRSGDVPLELSADQVQFTPGGEGLTVTVTRLVKGQPVVLTGLPSAFQCEPGSTVHGSMALNADRFSVTNGGSVYHLVFESPCGGALALTYNEDSPAGQALGIWQIATLAEHKLTEAVDMGFWRNSITFVFPADGDYYQWGTVHITRGDHWDVVGHEMGHAIYDQGGLGAFGGGQHYIDQCYSGAMALSEGWASYFSAWVSVALNDADAKFEYMVPRRAPIRFENVPDDVCAGPDNEWRVNAFFWDLIDLNDDGEQSTETFAKVWNAMLGSGSGDAGEAATKLVQAGFDEAAINRVWQLNFKQGR